MSKIIVKNGLVFDPLNNINGEIKDILIEDSKIVEKFSTENEVKEIDANGKTVIPGAIDIHAHIAAQQINLIRLLGTNNNLFQEKWKGLTLESIARDYISNGYTFVLESNVFPSLAKHTIFNFKQIPVLDKAMLLNVSNMWPLEFEFQKNKYDEIAVFLSNLLLLTKGFGLKVYNPFESEIWNLKTLRKDLSIKGKLYNFSALDVFENLIKANEYLGLPHSVHAHIEGYEQLDAKNNLSLVLDKIKSLQLNSNLKGKSKIKRSQIFHLAHASAYNIDGNNSELINTLNSSESIDLDLGFLGFDSINPLITSDRRLINFLTKNNNQNQKLITSAVENEGDTFAMFRKFDKKNVNDCILWANALDLALNVKNKWQLQFSINYPNYADINDVPEIATYLMSSKARKEFMQNLNKEFLKKNNLTNMDQVLTFKDYVIITRASPAKSLGLGEIKGNLGINSDADINILDIDINEMDISKNYEQLKNSLSNIEYVIKSGKIVKNKEKFDLNCQGKIFWSQGFVEKDDKSGIMKSKTDYYKKFGSIFYESLAVSIKDNYLREIF